MRTDFAFLSPRSAFLEVFMRLEGKHVVVTGGASGIGRALARRFAAEGARGVVVADLDAAGCDAVAAEVKGTGVPTDVADPDQVKALVARAEDTYGPVDLFCSNAGIAVQGGVEAPDDEWERIWQINVMSHVYAARAVLPSMLERGEGYLLNTASAAGLLNQIGSAPYGVTKHAAVGLAEWLAITYGDRGIQVSVLCPQAVRTAMTAAGSEVGDAGVGAARADGMLEPEECAEAVVAGLTAESFLILPHPEVLTYLRRKADDYDRWIAGMQRFQQRLGFVGEIP
jgi:NAD(P)-dependent dehydrogenase (short-subunit alcohol dehydrogenase family)